MREGFFTSFRMTIVFVTIVFRMTIVAWWASRIRWLQLRRGRILTHEPDDSYQGGAGA